MTERPVACALLMSDILARVDELAGVLGLRSTLAVEYDSYSKLVPLGWMLCPRLTGSLLFQLESAVAACTEVGFVDAVVMQRLRVTMCNLSLASVKLTGVVIRFKDYLSGSVAWRDLHLYVLPLEWVNIYVECPLLKTLLATVHTHAVAVYWRWLWRNRYCESVEVWLELLRVLDFVPYNISDSPLLDLKHISYLPNAIAWEEADF